MILLAHMAVAGAAIVPAPALACGASPTPTFTITGLWPGDGAIGVARNSGIVVTAAASSEPGGPGFPVVVTLVDVLTGTTVPGRPIEWYSDQPTAAWYPVEPLLPERAYRLEASVTGEEIPTEDSDTVTSTFVTSGSLLAPLVLLGDIEISLSGSDFDVQACENTSCGPANCVAAGTRRALMARIELPAAEGGQAPGNAYRARLYFTDDAPPSATEPDLDGVGPSDDQHDVQITHYLELVTGEPTTLEQEIFEEDFDYAPCFTFVVWDPAGHKVETATCLPVMSPEEVRSLAGISPTASSVDGTASSDGAVEPYISEARSSGCALRGSPGHSNFVLAALAALLVRLSRRCRAVNLVRAE